MQTHNQAGFAEATGPVDATLGPNPTGSTTAGGPTDTAPTDTTPTAAPPVGTALPTDTAPAPPRPAEAVDAKGRPLAVVPARVPWLEVGIFVVVAAGLAWLAALPLWTSGEGLSDLALVQAAGGAMMLAPLVATVIASIVQRVRAARSHRALASVPRYLGIGPLRPFGRIAGAVVGAFLGVFVLVAAGYLLSAAFGWVDLDLTGLSGFKSGMNAIPGLNSLPTVAAVAVYLLIMGFNSIITAFLAFGEEVGWRGWLLTSLRPLGTWPALLIVGIIWGLWHAPLILLGYNFSRPDITGLGFMVGGCIMLGILFGWLRLRTGSVWPAVFGHAALNGSSGMLLVLIISADAPTPDMALITTLGVAGWIVSAIVIAVLVATGQFRKQPELGIKKAKPAEAAPQPLAQAQKP